MTARATDHSSSGDGRFETVAKASVDGLLVIDGDGIVQFANPAAVTMFAEQVETLVGFHFGTPAVRETTELQLPGKGEMRYVEMRASQLSWNGQEATLASLRDITERKRMEEALRDSEQKFKTLIKQTPAALFLHEMDGSIVDYNRFTLEKYGFSADEILNIKASDIDPDYREREGTGSFWEELNRKGQLRFEARHRKKSGVIFPVEVNLAPIEIKGKKHYLALALDITERKQAEEALRESEALLSRSQEIAHTGSWKLDLTANRLTWSDEVYRIFGCKPQEFAPTYESFLDFVHPEDRASVDEAYSRSVREGSDGYEIEHRIVRRNSDEVRHVHERCVHGRDAGGTIIQSAGMVHDITERKKAEAELSEQQALLTAIYLNAPLVLMVVDTERRIRQVNDFVLKFTGRPVEEMLGLRGGEALRCLHALDNPQGCEFGEHCNQCIIRNTVLDTLESGETHLHIEAPYQFSDKGEIRMMTFLLSTTPLTVKDEQLALVTLHDITELKQAQAEQKLLSNQLAQAQKMESVGRLAGGVAHDFNNMLSVIMGHTELALEDLVADNALRHNLEEIWKAAERSASLTQQLLAFARKQTISPRVLDLNETISSMIRMLERLIGEDIDFLWKPGAELAPVRIDPGQVNQILANLVVNARDAIGHGNGKVTIGTSSAQFDEEYCAAHTYLIPGDYIMLAVSDNGCGMDEETRSHIFEPFFTTKSKGQGTGLGLATIYGIVKQNNGFIIVYSEPGEGTTIRIYLPALEAESSKDPDTSKSAAPVGGPETILIVEDEAAILKLTRTILEHLGYTVLTAATPGEAIHAAHEWSGKLDLVITDVIMPEMNGQDLARRLQEYCPDIRVLFMSGYTADVISRHGVLDEDVSFIEKPFSQAALATKIRETLEK